MNKWDRLSGWDIAVLDTSAIDGVLEALHNALEESEVKFEGEVDLSHPGIEDDCDRMENLLGLAFISCQIYITGIYSYVLRKRATTAKELRRQTLLAEDLNLVPPSQFSRVQVIDSFANYFKHRDEWGPDWGLLKNSAAFASQVVSSVGAQPGSTGNMRTGASALGLERFSDVNRLRTFAAEWAETLLLVGQSAGDA